MRDDLSCLFQKLVLLYKEKLACLERIRSNEIQLRYLLQSSNVPGISDLIKADNEIFLRLDSLEFDIQSLTDNICKAAGIDRKNFAKYFLDREEEPLPELKNLKGYLSKLTSDLIKERDSLIIDMEKKLKEIKIDIDTLRKIRELDID